METPTTQANPAADEHAHQNAVMKASLNEAGDADQRLEWAALMDRACEFLYGSGKWTAA